MLPDETTPDSVIKKTLEAFRSYQQERRGIKGSSLARLKSADGLDEHKGDAGVDADEEEAEGGDGGFHIGLSRRQRVESGQVASSSSTLTLKPQLECLLS